MFNTRILHKFAQKNVHIPIYTCILKDNLPPSTVLAVTIIEGLPSPADVLAVTKHIYCVYGSNIVFNVTASMVPFTTDLMVGIFGPITCSGYA